MWENLANLAWQDLVLMIAGFVLAAALISTLKSKEEKPTKSTCCTTGGTLLAICICYATLGLWLAFISTLLTAIMWFAILVQKIIYDKKMNPAKPAS